MSRFMDGKCAAMWSSLATGTKGPRDRLLPAVQGCVGKPVEACEVSCGFRLGTGILKTLPHRIGQPSPNFGPSAKRPSLIGFTIYQLAR
jgi:hypothetical protein